MKNKIESIEPTLNDQEILNKEIEATIRTIHNFYTDLVKVESDIRLKSGKFSETDLDILKFNFNNFQKIDDKLLEKIFLLPNSYTTEGYKSNILNHIGYIFKEKKLDNNLRDEDADLYFEFQKIIKKNQDKLQPLVKEFFNNGSMENYFMDSVKKRNLSHINMELNFLNDICTDSEIEYLFSEKIFNICNSLGIYDDKKKILEIGEYVEKSKLLDLIDSYGNDNQKKLLEELIFDSITNCDYRFSSRPEEHFLSSIDNSHIYSNEDFPNAINMVKVWFEKKFGFSLGDITKNTNLSFKELKKTLSVVSVIEKSYPKGSKKLSEEYGIYNFFRYPPNPLIKQLSEENIKRPYGIFVTAYDDHNGAFNDGYEVGTLASELNKNDTSLKIIEVGSGFGLIKRLLDLDKKFGDSNKISFLILNAHGQKNSFLLSEIDGNYGNVHKDMLSGKGVRRMKDFFIPHPNIILQSCSTGKETGIGEKIAEIFDAYVIAPKVPTATKELSVKFDENKNPIFNVEFYEGGVARYIPKDKNDDEDQLQ